MEIIVEFPGALKVDAHFDGFTVSSDQPISSGGENLAPAPYKIFLASIGNCAGYYVLSFCKKHDLPTKGIRVVQRVAMNETTHLAEAIEIEIQVPVNFPVKYYDALVRAANFCKVKQSISDPPLFNTFTKVV